MTSPASLFVAQMQDWLELGEGSRINTPAQAGTTGSGGSFPVN